MLTLLRKLTPQPVRQLYHWVLALAADRWYGRPSERLIVIGVTGTSGKSTVIELLRSILEAAGFRAGIASTIKFSDGRREWSNKTKMTMVGRFGLQRLLADMVAAGCRFAVIETSSQGIAQSRHLGIHYDLCVLTNLYPEHLDAHGGYVPYRQAKLELFRHLARRPQKTLRGEKIPRTIVVNLDNEFAPEFLGFAVEQKFGYTLAARYDISGVTEVRAEPVQQGGSRGFRYAGQEVWLKLPGAHNVSNALAALTVAQALGVALPAIGQGLTRVAGVPGRIEFVAAGQPFTVIVDYAFEPHAMRQLYAVVEQLPHRRIIQVLGTTGGGRDRGRGHVLGEMAGRQAAIVVVTNEDPYNDDPRVLMERVAAGARAAGKVAGKDLWLELDRRAGIRQAVMLAEPGDAVLITGKGCEQAMVVAGGKKIPWDDREVVLGELENCREKKLWNRN